MIPIKTNTESVSENSQKVESAREKTASSPQPSPPPASALLWRGKEEVERERGKHATRMAGAPRQECGVRIAVSGGGNGPLSCEEGPKWKGRYVE